jgi:hypothetical protein
MQFLWSLRNTFAAILSIGGIAAANIAYGGTCSTYSTPVWTYTPPPDGTDAIFTGTTDLDGNLYWIEFQLSSETQQLVSASRDGSIRYRIDFDRASTQQHLTTRGAIWAYGRVLVATEDNHVRAFEAPTGTLLWDIAVGPGRDRYAEITDTGTGVLVVTYGNGLTGLDAETGERLWTHSGWTAVAGANGDIYLKDNDNLTKIDPSGMDIWSQPASGEPVAVAPGDTPLIEVPRRRIGVQKKWWEIPTLDHYNVVVGTDFGFLLTWQGDPPGHLLKLQSFTADASLMGQQTITPGYPISFNGVSLLTRDHLLLISQETGPCPCLCHPQVFRQARVSAWSSQAEQLFSCDLTDLGEAAVEGASLFYSSLVIARRNYLTDACTTQIQPVIIEAYHVPGEELAEQGWVTPAGNAARSRRPLR